jgi:disulfide bond formation protein DsbB
MLKKMKRMYPHQSLMMIFIIGLLAITASFVIQYIFNVQPCEMCYWQRYLVIAITVVAFIGTLFRGKIKKWFLATICALAVCSLAIASWQSLAQRGIVSLPTSCAAPINEVVTTTTDESVIEESKELLSNIEAGITNYVDCSKAEDFFLAKYTGITLANVNVALMLFISVFSFYKLFFKPRKRFRKYNNHYNKNKNSKEPSNNNNHRYRGSGYRRSNNRNNNRNYNKNTKKD